MKFLSGLFLLVLVNGIRGLPRPTEFPSEDHSYDDEFSVPQENDPLPTPPSPRPSEDEVAEPDSLAWDEDEMYHTRPQKFEDKPSCAHAIKMVEKINAFRRIHGAGPLLLDLAISKEAAAWANLIRNSGKAKLNPKAKYGQDVCIAPKGDKDVPKTCGTDFYKTVQFYNWATHKLSAKNSFFAQMVWKSVQRVGIGCATGPLGRTYVVAYFDKTGSKSEEAQANVQGYTDVFTSVPGVKCDAGYTEYQGTCYKFDTEAKTWEDALKTCANDGAVLVNVKNAHEEMLIKNLQVPKGKKKGEAWLALNDITTEGTYTSADGSGIEYMNWKIGEPHGKGQNCVTFNSESQFGSMADIKCTEKKQFICKKPLEGDVVFAFKIETGAKYTSEFANPYSAATKKFKKNLEEDLKEALKAIKSLKIVVVDSLIKKEEKKKGKRATPKKTATPPATTDAIVYIQFGPKTPVDPATPIVEYIAKNKGKLPKLSETAKVQSVSIVHPGQEPPSLAQAIAAKAAAKAAAQAACGIPSCYGSCAPQCPSRCCGSSFGSPFGNLSPYPQPPSPYPQPPSPFGSPYGASPSPCAQPPCPPPVAPSLYGQVPQPQTPKHLTMQNVKQQKAAAAAPACGQYGQPACSSYGQVAPSYGTPFVQQPSVVAAPCVRSATGQCLPKPLTIRFPLVKNAKARSVCRGNNCNSPLPYQIAPAQPPFIPPPPQPFGTPYGVPYGAAMSASPYAVGYGRYGNPCLPPLNCNTKTKKGGKKSKKLKKKSKAVVSSYGGSYGGGPPFAFSSFGSNQYGQQPSFAANPCGTPLNPCAPPPVAAPQPPPFGNPCVPSAATPCYGKRAVLPKPQQSPFGLSPFGANPCAAPPCPPPMPPMMPPMPPMMPPVPPANRCAVPPCPPPMPPMPPMLPRLPLPPPCAAPPCPPPMPPMPPMPPRLPLPPLCAAPPCPPPMPPMPPMPPRLPLPPPCAAPPCPPPMPPMPPMPPRLPLPPPCAAPPCPPPLPPMGVAIGMMPQSPFTPNPFNPCIPSAINSCTPSPATKKGKGKAAAKKAPKAPPAPQFQSLYGFTSPPMSLLPPPPLFGANPCAPQPLNPNPCAPKPAPKKGKSAKPKSKSKAPKRPASQLGLNPYAQPSPFGSPFNPCGAPPMIPCAPPMLPPMPPPMPPMPPVPPPVPAFGAYPPPPFGSPFGANPCNPAFSPCPPPKPKATPKKGKKLAKKPAAPKVPQPQIIPPQYPGGPLTVQMPPMVMPVSMPANQLPFGLPALPNPSQCAVGCLARATCPTYCSAACCKRGRTIRAKKSQIFRRLMPKHL